MPAADGSQRGPRVEPEEDGARGELCGKPAIALNDLGRLASLGEQRIRRQGRHRFDRHSVRIQILQLGFTVGLTDLPGGDQGLSSIA